MQRASVCLRVVGVRVVVVKRSMYAQGSLTGRERAAWISQRSLRAQRAVT